MEKRSDYLPAARTMKCDKCNKPATVHLIEIQNGQKIEKHLCEEHAAEDGIAVKVTNQPINDLLEKFVLKQTGQKGSSGELVCEACGTTWSEFRKTGLLGCPTCYAAFEGALMPLLERAHPDGAHRHMGKVPQSRGTDEHRNQRLLRLRRELDEAVNREQYERAARLRDQVREVEEQRDESA